MSHTSRTYTSRKGEPPSLRPRRNTRCFQINSRWYVTTRGAHYVGPFSTWDAANDAARQISELLQGVDDANVAEAFVREFSRRHAEAIAEGSTGNG